MKRFFRRRSPFKNLRSLVEPLEARIAPAANAWISLSSGNWNTAANWSDGVPTFDDVVTINPAGTLTITIDSGAQVAASVSMPGDDALAISGGSLTLTAPSVLHSLALGGSGSLFANAAVSLTGAGSFTGTAVLGGSGVVTNSGTLGITSGEPNLQAELVVANGATVSHGNAFLDLDGAAGKLRVISGGVYESVNTGSGFGLRALGGTTGFFVETGGVFRHASPNGASFDLAAAVPFKVNGGTVQNTGASGTVLNLSGIGTFANATLVPSVNTAINFSGNNNTIVGTITGSGAGAVNFGSGQLHAAAGGATLNFPAGLFNVGGTGVLSGPGIFTNTGTVQISSGEPDLATELVNAGTIRHGQAYLDFDGATSKLRVVSGGLYESVNVGSGFGLRAFNNPAGIFIEAGGIFRHASPNGASFDLAAALPFSVNGGTVQNAGAGNAALNLSGVGTFTNATLVPAAGTTINFSGNNNTIVGTITGSGAGAVNFGSGQLHAAATGATLNFPVGLFNVGGTGVLSGPGIFTNTGTLQISSGEPDLATELVNAGTIRQANAYLDFEGATSKLRVVSGGLYESVNTGSGFGFRALNNPAGLFVEAGGVFRHASPNGASFDVAAAVPFSVNGGTVQNTGVSGTVLNLSGIGTFTNATLVPSANTAINFSGNNNTIVGTITGSGAGAVNFGSGQLHAAATGATLNFPAGLFNVGGTGALSGPGIFTNTGTFQISSGEPNLATELVNAGTIRQANAYLDFDGATSKLRVVSGGLYESVNTGSGFGFRALNNPAGLFVEAGGVFRHASPNGASFDVAASVPFSVNGGTVQNTGAGNAALNLSGVGTFTNATFTPSLNTTINFSGNNNTIAGTITGSGAGAVNFGSGQLHAATTGATLNFAAGVFNVAGTGALSGPGVFTNTGTIQITSGEPNLQTELVNAGTIRQGNAFLDFDGAASKLRVVSGGVFESVNSGSGFGLRGLSNPAGVFIEAGGVFRHAATNGASFNFESTVPLSNLGTVATTGTNGATLFVNGPVAQKGTNSLTAGTWEVANATTLNLGNGFSIATNAAKIIVHGTGGFSGLGALATNSGALSLLEGADLTTNATTFTNSGALTLSAGSVLALPGTFTQTATGATTFQIGGATAAQVGRIAATGAASLAGTANLEIANAFAPTAGQTIALATYASKTGDFSKITGLGLGRAAIFEATAGPTAFNLNSLVNAADLAAQTITTPVNTSAGANLAVSYSVKNLATNATLATTWVDTLYLSKDGTLDSSDIVLARVTHTGALAAGATYTENLNVPLTGALEDNYRVLVLADSQGRVPDPNRADNLGASAGTFALSIPLLTAGTAFNGTIASGQDVYFQVALPSGVTPSFTLSGAVAGEAEIYETLGAVPTRGAFDASTFALDSTVQRIVGDASAPGTYYVLLHGREAAGAGQNFTFTVSGLGFDLVGLDLNHGANVGKITTTLLGAQFTTATTFTLVPASGPSKTAGATYFQNASTATATFDLTGLAAGSYSVVATDPARGSDTLAGAFTVTAGGTGGVLQYNVSSPRYIRPPFVGSTVTITYQNTGDTDLDAPIFNLFADNARVRLADQTGFLQGTYFQNGRALTGVFELLGVSGGLAGVLSPGEKGSIEVVFEPVVIGGHVFSNFGVDVVSGASAPINLDLLKSDLRPLGVSNEAWDAVFANFKTNVGATRGSYQAALVDDANYLGQFGKVSPDVARLLSFEIEQADDFGAISDRYTLGDLGRGRTAPFSLHTETDEFGNVSIIEGQSSRGFVKLADGTYRATWSDVAKLTRSAAGAFTLDEVDGTKTVFRASDGRIDFIEDTNGHRFTAAWSAAGKLQSITDNQTNDVTLFTYNAQGRLATATDPVGRATTYGYDAGGEHLTTVATPAGTTTYTYAATGHAVTSLTGADGVTTTFSYDALGRLTHQSTGSGAGAVVGDFAYDTAGKLTKTDGQGHTAQLFRTIGGSFARTVDALGNVTGVSYDNAGHIVSVTDPNGVVAKTSLNAQGVIDGVLNSDHTKTQIHIGGDLRRLQSVVDASGDATTFSYDAKGNLTATLLPDGFGDHFEYDAQGRSTAATNANGERVTFTYDTHGLVTKRTLPDGSAVDFTYDAHRNLLTATDSEGATTFTYDTADRVKSIAYPNGKTITLTYDAAGRRATVADQTGYTVRYTYDALGHLDEVRDTANALLVNYDYNALGQLATETRGNGATTSYAYDAAGNVTTITHRDAANAVIASFAYTYDAQSRVSTVTDATGTTSYTYDVAGQLTGVALPGGRTIAYSYDADGNRTVVADSAAGTANYLTNRADQYTTAGAETLGYDRAGRLISRTEGGVVTSYSYDINGHLTGVITAGSVIAYDYDALGNRIGKIENGVRTDFAYDPAGLGTVFGEYQGASTVAHYASGLGIAARADSGNVASFYHFDANGNTALLSGAGGAKVAGYTYLPFGKVATQTGASAQPFTFDGREGAQDDAGDLFNLRARTYDAKLGRFTSRDPLGVGGGDTNTYRYVRNNPVNLTDPSGLEPLTIGGLVVLDAFGNAVTTATGTLGTASLPYLINGYLPLPGAPAVIPAAGAPLSIPAAGSGPVAQAARNVVLRQGGPRAALAAAGTFGDGSFVLTGAGSLGAGGVLVVGALTAGAGVITGTAIDRVTEHYFPEGKQRLRNEAGYGLDPAHPPTQDIGLVDKDFNRFIKRAGGNALLNLEYKFYVGEGLSPEDAFLKARANLRKTLNDIERKEHPQPTTTTNSEDITPNDPNNISGPFGAGADPLPENIGPGQVRFDGFVNGTNEFAYRVDFENKASASAPAQIVKVTQTLDADLDLSTFHFRNFGWSAFKLDVPATTNGTSFHQTVDQTATLGVKVQVDADLNTATRVLTVTYISLDPITGDAPADPLAGFLPPNDATGRGDGYANYSVAPKSSLTNGTQFDALATVIFDTELPIDTPMVHNTLDKVAPTSTITPFGGANISRSTFVVHFTATDDAGGSGIRGTNIFYTDTFNGVESARQILITGQAGNGARFDGALGHTYKFFSQAVDNADNVEALSAAPQAQVTVVAPTFVNVGAAKTFVDSDGDRYTIRYSGPGVAKVALLDPDGDGRGAIDLLQVDGSTATSALSVTVVKGGSGNGRVNIGDVTVNGALRSFVAQQSELVVNGFTATRSVGGIAVGSILRPDAVLADPMIKVGGVVTDSLSVSAVIVADGFKLQTPGRLASFVARSIGDGAITARTIGTIQTNAGDLAADITAIGGIGALVVKSGDLSGHITARNFGAVSVTGGDFSGELTSLATAASLGVAPAISSIAVTGGDFTGDLRVLGNTGAITMSALRGIGGSITGASINAARIASLIVGRNVGTSTILAGADLGADHALGGTGFDGDTFGRGFIGPVVIGGAVNSSILGAGLSATDGIFHNGNDTIVGGTASRVAALTIRGSAAGSYFAAGLFVPTVKIGNAPINPARDVRFFVG